MAVAATTATLSCGAVLTYESASFVPAVGESVPCRWHGYCEVESRESSGGGTSTRRFLARARPRERGELEHWLRGRARTTVHALRHQRFTLRMLRDMEREGLVDVDVWTGEVSVNLRCKPEDPHGASAAGVKPETALTRAPSVPGRERPVPRRVR